MDSQVGRADSTAVGAAIPKQRGSAKTVETAPAATREWLGAGIRQAWPALALYAGLRTFSIITLWIYAEQHNRTMLSLLWRYDAPWYTKVVEHGYDATIPLRADGTLGPTNLAFFPLYPGLTAALDPIIPGNAAIAGIVITWICGIAAAWGLYAIGAHLRDRRTGIILAALWGVLPHALVQSMGYTEPLFTALAAWSLFAVLRRRWLTAGVLCLFAGLTRPTGAAIVFVIGLTALIAVIRRRDGWRPWVCGVLAPLGYLGYATFVGVRLGRWDGYWHVQKDAWGFTYDTGAYTVSTTNSFLTQDRALAEYVVTLVLLVFVTMVLILILDRWPWQLIVFSAILFAMVFFGDSYYNAKARHLMPAFPVLLPIAYALAAGRKRIAGVVIGMLALISTGYGVYLALVWVASP